MANQDHLDILKQGVEVWNQWRKEHLDIRPDLSLAELSGVNLKGVHLFRTNLIEANFSRADLIDAALDECNLSKSNFQGANLNRASFSMTDLFEVNLTEADLSEAILYRAYFFGDTNLTNANLHGANLNQALFRHVDLYGADFSGAALIGTIFGDVDLSTAKGQDVARHPGPSTIGLDTIYRSGGNIPEVFLKGAGVPDSFIDYMRSLVGKTIDYYSCFISYSSRDDAFARRLYADLQSNNVRCWFAPEDLKWGEKIHTGIDEAIRLHDKLILILSKHSIASGWVEHEVKTALARERKEKRTTLFPVRVDQAIFDSPLPWTTEIRQKRNIGDFTNWKNHDDYQKAFILLLRDLKAEAPRRL